MESSFFVFCRNLRILVLPQMSVPEAFFILAEVPTRTPLSNAPPLRIPRSRRNLEKRVTIGALRSVAATRTALSSHQNARSMLSSG